MDEDMLSPAARRVLDEIQPMEWYAVGWDDKPVKPEDVRDAYYSMKNHPGRVIVVLNDEMSIRIEASEVTDPNLRGE